MDDDTSISNFLEATFKIMGYSVFTAANGAEVLNLMKEHAFKFIMLDLTIPGGMGGIETATEIRKIYGDKDIILAMSGYADGNIIADPRSHKFNGSISKPFRIKDIHNLLETVIK